MFLCGVEFGSFLHPLGAGIYSSATCVVFEGWIWRSKNWGTGMDTGDHTGRRGWPIVETFGGRESYEDWTGPITKFAMSKHIDSTMTPKKEVHIMSTNYPRPTASDRDWGRVSGSKE